MLKVFWDKDNIAFISNQVNATEHAHCVLQGFLSFDEPLQITVSDKLIQGKCIVVNKNVKHVFSSNNKTSFSILIEPSSSFANDLIAKMNGDYLICEKDSISILQQKAARLVEATDKQQYISFVRDFAEFLGSDRKTQLLDARIVELMELLQNCDCYDHAIENFANRVSLSSSRLSHLFREQIGVPLKSYILFHQLEKAFAAVFNGQNITEAAMSAGFDSPSHFAATVKKWMGTPVSALIKDSEFLKVFN